MSGLSMLRYAVYTVSGAAMIAGVLVMMGYFIPRYFPEQYRVVIGAVVFLYGGYRFALTYVRAKNAKNEKE